MKALILMLSVIAAPAMADGFECENLSENVRIQVYNEVQPSRGTRSSAVMVISDPSVKPGRKTIAKFEAADGLLDKVDTAFVGKVDLRFSSSGRAGENLASTKLGEVDQVILDIDFHYSEPVEDEAALPGMLILKLRSGEYRQVPMACERYLKH
jgi:hypothetical protein